MIPKFFNIERTRVNQMNEIFFFFDWHGANANSPRNAKMESNEFHSDSCALFLPECSDSIRVLSTFDVLKITRDLARVKGRDNNELPIRV